MEPGISMLGRYAVSEQIAFGGMGSVHVGRLLGPAAFARIVAVKKLHPHLADDEELVKMFLDEARLASRIRHPNVVPTLDVGTEGPDIFLVMEYVHGESLHVLLRAAEKKNVRIPCNVLAAILVDALHGLHAAHDATSEQGQPLNLVHRDVSPQNILVGNDGVARVVDFGVAKAAVRDHITRDGAVKGKLPYMAPEQLRGSAVDRRTDLYSASVILWEGLTGRRLFLGESEGELLTRLMDAGVDPPSRHGPFTGATPEETQRLDAIALRGLAHDPNARFANAQEMATALERGVSLASKVEVAALVKSLVGERIEKRAASIADFERATATLSRAPSDRPPGAITPPPTPHTNASTRVALAIALGVVIGVGILGAIASARGRHPAPIASSAPSASASAPFDEEEDSPSAAVSPLPPSSPTASTTASARRRSRGTKPHPTVSGSTSPPPPAPPPDCDPPYTRGPDGVILHKPECYGVH